MVRAIEILIFMSLLCQDLYPSGEDSINIYMFHGQGADNRVFENLSLEGNYRITYINYPVPGARTTLKNFALSMINQIDTMVPCILIGQSMGGMICTELADTLKPVKVIIISSAKCRQELPGRYRFQRYIPVNRLVPKRLIKVGAVFFQPLVEPDCLKNPVFRSMILKKDPRYMKRTVKMIINWERKEYSPGIIHIHGENDSTIPVKNVKYDYLIRDGSHVMVYTRGTEISSLIQTLL